MTGLAVPAWNGVELKIWLPYLRSGSGSDVYVELLARALKSQGIESSISVFDGRWQHLPWALKRSEAPPDVDVIIANSWNAFAFARAGKPLFVVEHHCVFDQDYLPYRSTAQALYHNLLVRRFEMDSFALADRIICVSEYTAASLGRSLGITETDVISNAIDTGFFTRGISQSEDSGAARPFRLLFVGNHSRRKGFDLLSPIMKRLGDGFELRYTVGLGAGIKIDPQGVGIPLGRLDIHALREQYRAADVLIFPSRLEGFGYAAAEAMACGTPVVAARSSSLPELIRHRVSGVLCPTDDIDCFAGEIRKLRDDPEKLAQLGDAAREQAKENFDLVTMGRKYARLLSQSTGL